MPDDVASANLVLRIITRLNIGGPSRHVLILNRGLPAHGFQSYLVYGSEDRNEGVLFNPDTASTYYVPQLRRRVDPVADSRAALALHHVIKDRHPDIVHTHMAKAGALGRMAALRARVPIVVHTFHGHVLSGYFRSALNRALIDFERRMARRTTMLVAVSDRVRDELLSFGIGEPGKWRTIPLGLELEDFVAQNLVAEEARRRVGLPEGRPAVGIVGRLVPVKDVNTFLTACQLVARENQETIFVVAGDGPLRESIEAQAHSRLGDRIRFLGWVSDLPDLYAALDVVVLTSRNEGTPVALIEASASARPVIGTHVGGVPDVIKDGETGFLVPPGDPQSVAERVLYLLGNPGRAQVMGTSGRHFVKDRFSSQRLINDVASLYRELLQ